LSVLIPIAPADFVQSVTVTYGTPSPEATGHPPVVEVRGRYSETWTGAMGENRQYAGGWILFGAVDVVAMPHRTRQPLRIAGQQGPFKKLRFVAQRGTVDLASVNVRTADGQDETLAVNALLMPGQSSAPVSFSNGAALIIGSIALAPRLNAQSHIDATVEVWAQY
jgi:hypothetical protein